MSDEVKKWLQDILESIQSIDDYVGEVRRFEVYEKDKKLRRAVERELEIIGEAVNRIRKTDDSVQIEQAHQIVATRNRVIHAYDAVNNAMIWGIVINHLPKLKIEIKNLLSEEK